MVGLDNLLTKVGVFNLHLVGVDGLETLVQDFQHLHQLLSDLLRWHILQMRSFHGIVALCSSHVGSKMNGTCPMINGDLHIIVPNTIHDDPLKCEGIGELGQAQKPRKNT